MTPQERQLINELFQRLASLESNPRDPDAEAMIREGLRRAPNGIYSLVQSVLVQDEALKAANNRIQEYEQQSGGPQQEQPQQPRGFLDSVRDSVFGRDEQRGSVPRVPQGGRGGRWTVRSVGPAARFSAPAGLSAATTGLSPRLSGWRADAAAGRWWRRFVPRHRGRRGGRDDRWLAADERHPLRDGWSSGWWAGIEGV